MSTTHADPADQRQHLIAQARQYLTEHEKTWDAENEATYQKYMDEIREATEAAEFRTGGVSQEEADRIMAGMYATGSGAPGRSTSTLGGAEVRELFRPADANKSLTMQATIPLGEARLEYPFLTTDTGSQSYGAYAVPKTIPALIVQSLVDESGFLSAGPTIIRSTSGEAMQVPYLSTAPDATAFKTEGAAATETDGILGKVDITTGHIAGYLSASAEFLADCAPDAEREIIKMCSQAVGKTLGTQLATGSGAVSGAFTTAAHGHVSSSQTTYSAEDLLDLRASLGQSYRGRRARWVFSDAAYTIALKMLDGEGNFLIQPAATAEGFDVLWGSPVFVDSYGPALATGNHVVLYGRPDAYWLRMVNGVEVTRSDEFAFTSWKSTFRFGLRTGGAIVDTAGLKALALA